jgi:tetratricopeptide (TPR) repeat protein
MPERARFRVIPLALATLGFVAAVITFGLIRTSRPAPTLEEVSALAQSSRFDEAATRGADYLRLFPHDARALLVMAEITLSGPHPRPELALEYLERIKESAPSITSWILVDRGNACSLLARFDRAERYWIEALRTDPTTLEAGRRLLELYRLQGRRAESRDLGARQFEREPSPHERLKLLVRLAQLDVDPPDPWLIVSTFQPALEDRVIDSPTTVALGLALVMLSRAQEGLTLLRRAVEHEPGSLLAWDALLSGLEHAEADQELSDALERLDPRFRNDVRFARHRAWLAQARGRWAEAAALFRQSWENEADNTVGYRLRRTLRLAGLTEEATRFDRVVLEYREAYKKVRTAVDEASAVLRDGEPAGPALCLRMAGLRQQMGRAEEAHAWRSLAPLSSARSSR